MTKALLCLALLAGLFGTSLRPGSHPAPAWRQEAAPAQDPRRTERDQEALRGFDFYLGTWVMPGPDPAAGIEFAWGIAQKSLHMRELRRIDGRLQPVGNALVGWHYGEQSLVFSEFVRDAQGFEVIYTGKLWFDAQGALQRRFQALLPGGASRHFRERFEPTGQDAWQRIVEVQDDDGQWQSFGIFEGERAP